LGEVPVNAKARLRRRHGEQRMNLRIAELTTQIGTLSLAASEKGLCAVGLDGNPDLLLDRMRRRFGTITAATGHALPGISDRLDAYFSGDLRALTGIPIDPAGTPFQLTVWSILLQIPIGQTISYAEEARRIGRPTATRAVAMANGANPIAIVIPCHRVIAADGTLGGYGGGIHRKEWLLRHEGAWPEVETGGQKNLW
jgi:methylated-DNA-[protein]-cysteine S-methyltransferase